MRLINIVLVILIIVLLIALFKRIRPKRDDFSDSSMIMRGGAMNEASIIKLINRKWPQVSIISNRVLLETPLSRFVWSEKTDGQHFNVLIYDGVIYDVTHAKRIPMLSLSKLPVIGKTDCQSTLILDTEQYQDEFYVFDAMYVDGNIGDKPFMERLAEASKYIEQLPGFKMKRFEPIPSINFLLDYIKNDKSPTTGHDIDGVILQRNDLPYISTETTVWKLKPRFLLTVDFKLMLNTNGPTPCYDLYLIGSYWDMLNNLKQRPREQKRVYDANGRAFEHRRGDKYPDNMLILFDSPAIPGLSTFTPGPWNSSGYSKRIIDHADHLMKMVHDDLSSLDGKIVEMSLTVDNKWVPIRIRTDKLTPNGYKIGLENVSLAFDPIKPESQIYFQKQIDASEEVQSFVHSLSAKMRQVIIETFVNPCNMSSAIDLCGGRGGDQYNLYANGIHTFFVIDQDTTALRQYQDRSFGLVPKYKRYGYKPMIKTWRRVEPRKTITLNILNHSLGENYTDIMNDLQSRYEWRGKVDLVIMNFAVHYICKSKVYLTRLGQFIKKVLKPDGRFIVTFYDGDWIYDNTIGGECRVGPWVIKVTEPKKGPVEAMMPLPTIRNGYQSEPLARRSILSGLETSLKLIQSRKVLDMIDELPKDPSNMIDYYRLVTVNVYTP